METLASLFLPIKAAHILLAITSGSLFAGRGLGVLLGARMPTARWVKRLSIGIDTALLVAALLLLSVLHLNPFTTPWLATKLLLLVAYIVLGVLALGRARSTRGRLLAYVAALLCFVMMFSIAQMRDPAGLLRPLL